MNNRSLIQITSPISHGSSGGPILNPNGEVVGVAVGMLEDGQNLNFAVPVAYVKAILDDRNATVQIHADSGEDLRRAKTLFAKWSQEEYTESADSDYQKEKQELTQVLGRIAEQSQNPDALKDVSCIGTRQVDFSDAGINAAQRLFQKSPSLENRELLAYVLYDRAEDEQWGVLLAKDGTAEQEQARSASKKYMSEAIQQATTALSQDRQRNQPLSTFVLGEGKFKNQDYAQAIPLLSQVAAGASSVCGNDLAKESYTSLVDATDKLNEPSESEKWFRRYAAHYPPSAFDWDKEGGRRSNQNDSVSSADAYERAAETSKYYNYDYCYASEERYKQTPTAGDDVLADGRKCVQASVNNAVDSTQGYFKSALPVVYRHMADVLHTRGVDQTALEYIKESLVNKPDDPFALSIEADIFDGLERYSECIAAAEAAIAASDGKHPWMHFRLGACYFATEN